jgi:hypothetical protein
MDRVIYNVNTPKPVPQTRLLHRSQRPFECVVIPVIDLPIVLSVVKPTMFGFLEQ